MSDAPAPLASLATEQRNPRSEELDTASSLEIVRLMNEEDARIAAAVARVLPEVARLVDLVVSSFRDGGRLFYVGAGTSGRLGALDAVECPPTFGVDYDMVQCLMAGGPGAWMKAVEGAEDSESAGAAAITDAGVTAPDTVIGIAASGRTPFVAGALREARRRGCHTAAVTNSPGSLISKDADIAIEAPVGPEILTGSTRLKAGTAQKMILNMITTAAMVGIGKCYGNLMVDVRATNLKLQDRARRIVAAAAGIAPEQAADYLEQAGGSAKVAILLARTGGSRAEAEALLSRTRGSLRAALQAAGIPS